MLIQLVEELYKKGNNHHEAKGVWLRHNLWEYAPHELRVKMDQIVYDPT
jgi:hypothetical protein